MTRLDAVLPGRDNNLNLIRMLAASAVLVSHAYPIALGAGTPEPLSFLHGQTLGHFAVAIFFGISGLLIARSFDRRRSTRQFVAARVLRLYPGLLVALGVTVLFGLFVTTLPSSDYLRASQTMSYIPRNMSLAFLQYSLPGVIEENPYGSEINGSLWTLFYEVACYIAVAVVGFVGIIRKRWAFTALFAALTASHAFMSGQSSDGGWAYRLHQLVSLAFPFALGTAAYVWREQLPLSWPIAITLWLLALPFVGDQIFATVMLVPLFYTTIWLAYIPKGWLLRYNRLGDFSYGTYIYAFPVQQALVYFMPGQSPAQNILLGMPPTVILAVLSWHLVEKRALAKVEFLASWPSVPHKPAHR